MITKAKRCRVTNSVVISIFYPVSHPSGIFKLLSFCFGARVLQLEINGEREKNLDAYNIL